MLEWIEANRTWLLGLTVVTFVGSLIAVPVLVARIPADYFMHDKPQPQRRHPALRVLVLAVKNLFGAVFVVAGIAMLITPGQGLLTILIGLMLLDFPGKRALELRIVRQPAVLQAINWIRAKANRPDLEVPQCAEPTPGDDGA